jgi:hypothetical protein
LREFNNKFSEFLRIFLEFYSRKGEAIEHFRLGVYRVKAEGFAAERIGHSKGARRNWSWKD